MGVREERHASGLRRALSWLPEVLVVLLVASAFANLQYDLGERWLGLEAADVENRPSEVLPPEGLDLVAGSAAPPVASTSAGGRIDPAAVRRAIAPYVRDESLGRHVAIAVSDLDTGRNVFRRGRGAVIPASTTKLLTAAAALEKLGPMTRFRTTVRQAGKRIVLVGGGDPFLATSRATAKGLYPDRATLADLATKTAVALTRQGIKSVRLAYDDSLFIGPRVSPDWPSSYLLEDVVPPITALWVDEGEGADGRYVADPSLAAANSFATALARAGIKVRGAVRAAVSVATDVDIAGVESAPVGQIVERTLAVSDNNAAEVLAHHIGIAVRQDGSFSGGTAAIMEVIRELGVDTTGSNLYDGSGLSRRNRLTPETLLGVLRLAASDAHSRLRAVITGLPVAGFTGSLQWRFDDAPAAARGRVRAKTGTLTGVHGLAGIATDLAGNRMAFVAVADRVALLQQLAARRSLDLLAGALGACLCGTASASPAPTGGTTAGPTS
jgi:D-alanyl-D-alanine carboxypeptidase/D-alanyl-D-alanine-endopeptidase (penicillin-binding protein 4)